MDNVLERVQSFISSLDTCAVEKESPVTEGSNVIVPGNLTGLFLGMKITGTGIPAGATVLSLHGDHVIMSGVASTTGISAVTFSGAEKFKSVEYSEYVEDLISKNKIPFVDVLGIRERKSPIQGMSLKNAERVEYDISLLICQDAKLIKGILHGEDSLWSLWNYTWGIIETDTTFNGAANRIAEKTIESQLMMFKREGGSVKLILDTGLTLVKDVFKK